MRYFVLLAVLPLLFSLFLCMNLAPPPASATELPTQYGLAAFALSGRPISLCKVGTSLKFYDIEAQKFLSFVYHDQETLIDRTELENADAAKASIKPILQTFDFLENVFEFLIQWPKENISYYIASFTPDGVLHIRHLDLACTFSIVLRRPTSIRVSPDILVATIEAPNGNISSVKYFSFDPLSEQPLRLNQTFELLLDGPLHSSFTFYPISLTGALVFCKGLDRLHAISISGFPVKDSDALDDADDVIPPEVAIQLGASVTDTLPWHLIMQETLIYPVRGLDGIFSLIGWDYDHEEAIRKLAFLRVSDPNGTPKFAPCKNIQTHKFSEFPVFPLSESGFVHDFFTVHFKGSIYGGLACEPCLTVTVPSWDMASGFIFSKRAREFTLLEYLRLLECALFNAAPLTLDTFTPVDGDKAPYNVEFKYNVPLSGISISSALQNLRKQIEDNDWTTVQTSFLTDRVQGMIFDYIRSDESLKVYVRFVTLLQREVMARDPTFKPLDLQKIFFPFRNAAPSK